MIIYSTVVEYDRNVCRPQLFATLYEAQKHMLYVVCEYLKNRGLCAKDDDGIMFSEENIEQILEEGFYIDEPGEQEFYFFDVEETEVFIDPYNTEVETLHISLFDIDVSKHVAEIIFRDQNRKYLIEDAEMQLRSYLALDDNTNMIEFLYFSNRGAENPKTKFEYMSDAEKFIEHIVDIYEKKCDCNIDENTTWSLACEIALKEIM